MVEIKTLLPKDEPLYREFLLSNPGNMIYATCEYRSFLASILKGEPVYLIAVENEIIVGALPFFTCFDKELDYSILNSLPWYGSHGGCTVGQSCGSSVRKALLQAYMNEVKKSKILAATLILTPEENNFLSEYKEVVKPDFVDNRIGQITELCENDTELENNLMSRFNKKTRNQVRKSLKQGFDIFITDEEWAWQFLYDTHIENISAIGGKPKAREHFTALRQRIPKEWRELSVAMLDDSPVAALLLLKFNRTIEYFTPVIKHEYRPLQPLSYLIWEGMIRAVKDGYRWWNWGGTWVTQESLHHFKSGWGAFDFPYTYLINVGEGSLPIIKNKIDELREAYPYYYIFPVDQL